MSTLRGLFLPVCTIAAQLAFTQPANDDPCGAVAINIDVPCIGADGTLVDASGTAGIGTPPCGNYLGGDVWFSFTAPTGLAEIAMTNASFVDGALALYTADSCDGAFLLIACDDDAGPGQLPLISRDDLQPGRTYWIRAFGYGGLTGTFSLCVTGPASFPEGDCVYRLELFDSNGDGWQGGTLGVSINGNAPSILTCATADTLLLVGLSIGDVLALSYSGGSDANENRYLLRYGTNGPAVFDSGYEPVEGVAFILENTCLQVYAPPVDCAYRLPICADTLFPGGNGSTGVEVDLTPANQGCLASGERAGIWAELFIAESGALGFTIAPSQTADFDFALWGPFDEVVCPLPFAPVRCSWAAQSGPTGLLASVADVSEAAAGDRFVDTLHVITGQRYVLFIDNFSSSGTPFDLTFQLTEGAALACTQPPVTAFTTVDNTVLVNEPVAFNDQSTGAPFSWVWSFPGANGDLSVAQDPIGITYPLPGCYDVSLTTTNIAGSDALTLSCEVEVSVQSPVPAVGSPITTVRCEQDALIIHRPGRTDPLVADLFDASGRSVCHFSDRGERISRATESFHPGCYSLVVTDGSGTRSFRLVLMR